MALKLASFFETSNNNTINSTSSNITKDIKVSFINLKRLLLCINSYINKNSGICKKDIPIYNKYIILCKSTYNELKDNNEKYNIIDENQLILIERQILFVSDLLIREQTVLFIIFIPLLILE